MIGLSRSKRRQGIAAPADAVQFDALQRGGVVWLASERRLPAIIERGGKFAVLAQRHRATGPALFAKALFQSGDWILAFAIEKRNRCHIDKSAGGSQRWRRFQIEYASAQHPRRDRETGAAEAIAPEQLSERAALVVEITSQVSVCRSRKEQRVLPFVSKATGVEERPQPPAQSLVDRSVGQFQGQATGIEDGPGSTQ